MDGLFIIVGLCALWVGYVNLFERLSKQGLIQRDAKWRWTATKEGREALRRG